MSCAAEAPIRGSCGAGRSNAPVAAAPGSEELLALLAAIPALRLRVAEEVGEFGVAVAGGVGDVGL